MSYQMSWNVKCHEMSNDMKCWMSNVKCQEISNVMKCQMSWTVECPEMSNVWSMTLFEGSRETEARRRFGERDEIVFPLNVPKLVISPLQLLLATWEEFPFTDKKLRHFLQLENVPQAAWRDLRLLLSTRSEPTFSGQRWWICICSPWSPRLFCHWGWGHVDFTTRLLSVDFILVNLPPQDLHSTYTPTR